MAALCGAPLNSGGHACRRKGRPCGMPTHVAYWRAHMPPSPVSDQESDDSDGDSVASADWSVPPAQSGWDSDEEGPASPQHAGAVAPSESASSSSTPLSFLHSADARTTVQRLYEQHLGQPYMEALKATCSDDWQLVVSKGERVHRPNHGLTHSVRVAYVVPLALRLLLQRHQRSIHSVPARDVHCAQYVMLFAVVGRENEISWTAATVLQDRLRHKGDPDAPHLYEQFKETGKRVLREHLRTLPLASLQLTPQEQEAWVDALDIGKPQLQSLLGEAMRLAHDADLMRCYEPEDFAEKAEDEFVEALGAKGAATLCTYVRALIDATGDRCMGYGSPRGYQRQLFASCSRDPDALLCALESVPQPLQHLAFGKGVPADKPDVATDSATDDDDDDSASTVSDNLSDLISAFRNRFTLKDASDVSRYEQLRFSHSRVITAFRKTPSCIRCFYVENDITHDIVMHVYTSPQLFQKLNLALCCRFKDNFLKMYSLLLCKAISDSPHDNLPAVLWRGVNYSDELLRLYQKHVGKVIFLYNFISTSRLRRVAVKHVAKKARPALIQLHVPADAQAAMADVAARSVFPEEEEVLIACNAGYRIDSVHLAKRTIELTVVDISKCLLGKLPNRMHAECKKEWDEEKWMRGKVVAAASQDAHA